MGYVLIYRATRVLNLAHGDLMVFGAFLFYQALCLQRRQPDRLASRPAVPGRSAARRDWCISA